MALARLHKGRDFSANLLPLLAGLVLLVGYLALRDEFGLARTGVADYSSPGAMLGVLILGLIFLLIIHGLLRMERSWRAPCILLSLGAASYALYLVHTQSIR